MTTIHPEAFDECSTTQHKKSNIVLHILGYSCIICNCEKQQILIEGTSTWRDHSKILSYFIKKMQTNKHITEKQVAAVVKSELYDYFKIDPYKMTSTERTHLQKLREKVVNAQQRYYELQKLLPISSKYDFLS